jgi:hypothetical protein
MDYDIRFSARDLSVSFHLFILILILNNTSIPGLLYIIIIIIIIINTSVILIEGRILGSKYSLLCLT